MPRFASDPKFWAAVAGPLVSLLVVRGLISTEDAGVFTGKLADAAVAVSYLVSQGLALHAYIHRHDAPKPPEAA